MKQRIENFYIEYLAGKLRILTQIANDAPK